MKRFIIVILVIGTLFLIPGSAMGLYTDGVSDHIGVVTVRSIDNYGWTFGGEFGLTPELAIIGDFSTNSYKRAGLKYQLNPDFAVLGGVIDSKLFLGGDFSGEFFENLAGIAEFDLYNFDGNNRIMIDYELGLKFRLTRKIDLRGGLIGTITETTTTRNYQLGVGYEF